MERNDGGSAFPQIETGYDDGAHEFTGNVYSTGGMTLRDYFAAKALSLGGEFFHNCGNGCDTPKTVAEAAYQIADEMLKARDE